MLRECKRIRMSRTHDNTVPASADASHMCCKRRLEKTFESAYMMWYSVCSVCSQHCVFLFQLAVTFACNVTITR